MLLLGCKPPGRRTEQHDIFFGMANSLKDLRPAIIAAWPEANKKIHVDAWREVNYVEGYAVEVYEKATSEMIVTEQKIKLFFLNLGGYKENEFEEFHYKIVVASENKSGAIMQAKATAFYKHTGFKGATSHIDDKYGVDVDDIFEIEEILTPDLKEKYGLRISPDSRGREDKLHMGYFKLDKL